MYAFKVMSWARYEQATGSGVEARPSVSTDSRHYIDLAKMTVQGRNSLHPFWCPKFDCSNLVAILGPIWPFPRGFSRTSEPTSSGHWHMP